MYSDPETRNPEPRTPNPEPHKASCWIRTSAAGLQDRSHNQLDQRSGLYGALFQRNADGRTRTRIDLFRRQAPDPFGHVRKLRSQGSNLESLGSKPSVLPVTPLRNVGGWGRIRTGCLWSFTPALFLMSFPTLIRGSKIEDGRSSIGLGQSSILNPQSSIVSPEGRRASRPPVPHCFIAGHLRQVNSVHLVATDELREEVDFTATLASAAFVR